MFLEDSPKSWVWSERKGMHRGEEEQAANYILCFLVNAAGGKEKPIIIWTSENPRCFKRFNWSLIPVTYHSKKKAWMTGDILDKILTKLNHQFS